MYPAIDITWVLVALTSNDRDGVLEIDITCVLEIVVELNTTPRCGTLNTPLTTSTIGLGSWT